VGVRGLSGWEIAPFYLEENMKITFFALILTLAAFSLGCSSITSVLASSEFSNTSDHFSVKFPGGSGNVETQTGKARNKYISTPGTIYSKSFDNRSDNYRSYEVNAFIHPGDAPADAAAEKGILSLGLNGWDSEPEAVMKDVTINGMRALDCVRTITLGPAAMTFREVVLYSAKEKRIYVLRIAASKKENVSGKDADEFINSFRTI
jgi:hypothetical protein